MRKLPLWFSLKDFLDRQVELLNEHPKDKDYWGQYPRSFCLVTLMMPELYPLHAYAMKILRKYFDTPKELSVGDIILSAAREDFTIKTGVRIFAIKSLADRSTEPKALEALISIASSERHFSYTEESFCVRGLVSSIANPKVQEAVLICLRNRGAFTVRSALDTLISRPEVLEAVVRSFAGGLCGLDEIIHKYLNDPSIVEYLILRLQTERNKHLLCELAKALSPLIDQEPVQRAFCQRLEHITSDSDWHSYDVLYTSLQDAQLFKEVKADYQDRIKLVKNKALADDMLERINGNIAGNRQILLTALCSENPLEKELSATLLSPFVEDDPEILDAFIERIKNREFGRSAVIIVSALTEVAHRKDIRLILIHEGPLDGKLSATRSCLVPELRLATIRVLAPFVNEVEVYHAFLSRLRSDEYPDVRCALLDILEPKLANPEVLNLFLEAAKDKLWRQSYHSGTTWQVAAIEKLEKMLHVPKVRMTLQELFEKSSYAVKAACVRTLGSVIPIDKFLNECINESYDVAKEAHSALISKLYRSE